MRLVVCLAVASIPGLGQTPQYTGPGSCASPSCHGSVVVKPGGGVQQNEYSTWVVKDKHARAAEGLTNATAKRMAAILGIEQADKAPRCLACHALDVPEPERARSFDTSDGVSCESCHGPASNWLGPHTTRGWTHEQSVQAGMRDLKNPVARAENCLSCHLGTSTKFVDHELIAAGHPDLTFELASFTAAMPPHWRDAKEASSEIRAFAVGQAVHLREQLNRVARNAKDRPWPDFADLDCFACHHSLTNSENSWQQARGYAGRRPGNPPWNLARFAVLRHLGNEVDRETTRQLEGEVNRLYAIVSTLSPDRAQTASVATTASATANRLVQKIATTQFDSTKAQRVLKAITGDADNISRQGERAAEQAAMAIETLYRATSGRSQAASEAEIRTAIRGLFQQLDNPSAYNAFKFADQLRALNGKLP